MSQMFPPTRRRFMQQAALAAAATATGSLSALAAAGPVQPRPRCITMWDFSWIERRWPGAGYEDWPRVLDELVERGYDAIRLDAFPHLIATEPEREWTLLPVWQVQDWGSPAVNRITRVRSALHEFLGLCRERGIKVGLSSWYREDAERTRLKITNAAVMAEQWLVTLAGIRQAGLEDVILYVDLCNEWPGDLWCPFFQNEPPTMTWGGWYTERSLQWMRESCASVRREFPGLPIGYSFEPREPARLAGVDLGFADYAEPHLWMAQANDGEFYKLTGYKYDRFTFDSYNAFAAKGEATYRERPGYWQEALREKILGVAAALQPHRLPLMTTECWGVVDYRDWPLLDWGWVKELCEVGVETAAGTGQWVAIATSNFAGPQFQGMWRDVAWHRRLNARIKAATIRPELARTKLASRL